MGLGSESYVEDANLVKRMKTLFKNLNYEKRDKELRETLEEWCRSDVSKEGVEKEFPLEKEKQVKSSNNTEDWLDELEIL